MGSARLAARFGVALALPAVALLAACGAPSIAQPEPPTPTPLPAAPELERPTYTVQIGTIERALEINGRVTPIDQVQLAFRRAGRVAQVRVAVGDTVKPGDVLAELEQADQIAALQQAEDTLAQAQRDLDSARQQRADAIAQADLELREAQDDLRRQLPGGADDPIRQAQRDLEQAQQAAEAGQAAASENKTNAEHDLLLKTEALQDVQEAYSTAWWNSDWVERYGTHPTELVGDPRTGKQVHRALTSQERAQFAAALTQAERGRREAERNLALAQRTLDQMRQAEISANHDHEQDVRDKQAALDALAQGQGSGLIAAQREVEHKRLALQNAQHGTLNAAIANLEVAQRALDSARRAVQDGQLIAPQAGQVLAATIGVGDSAEAHALAIEIADPARREVAAELSAEQLRDIQPGQPATVSLLARPDVSLPAVVRWLPSAIGAVRSQDHTTRFTVIDTHGQPLDLGAVVKIQIVLERKQRALWLPPEAVRAFEGRRFVVLRDGDRSRRVLVRVGIETPAQVELLGGLQAGDVVEGQ